MTSITTSSSVKSPKLGTRLSTNLEKARLKIPVLSRVPKKVFWIVLIVVVVAGAGTGAYAALRPAQTTAAATTAALQTATARQGDLVLEASGTGYLVAASESSIGFDISGKISSLDVKLGDTVEKGQLLAGLDDTSEQSALADA